MYICGQCALNERKEGQHGSSCLSYRFTAFNEVENGQSDARVAGVEKRGSVNIAIQNKTDVFECKVTSENFIGVII
jgi:hypothetical protein